jgi:hypothetical protein
MIRASEVSLGADDIDAYQSSVNSVLPNVIITASMDRNVGRKGSQMDGSNYGGTLVYDFFGPSSFFPISEPDNWYKRCDTDKVMLMYLGALRPAPAPVWTVFGHWEWPCRIHNLAARRASH